MTTGNEYNKDQRFKTTSDYIAFLRTAKKRAIRKRNKAYKRIVELEEQLKQEKEKWEQLKKELDNGEISGVIYPEPVVRRMKQLEKGIQRKEDQEEVTNLKILKFNTFCFSILMQHSIQDNSKIIEFFKQLLKGYYLKSIIEDPLCVLILEMSGNSPKISEIILFLMKMDIEFDITDSILSDCSYFEDY